LSTWVRRHSLVIFLALTAIGSLRIASTFSVFSQTYDQPLHIACGTEWLSGSAYLSEPTEKIGKGMWLRYFPP